MSTERKGTDQERTYEGKYIALDSSGSNRVIASGAKSHEVAERARKEGVDVPVIIYVPKEDASYLYQMPIRDYPFIAVDPRGIVSVWGPNAKPRLWIRLTNPATGKAMIVHTLIDTGADECAFPADAAPTLGHNLTSVPAKDVYTANGITKAYPHTSRVEVLGILNNGLPDPTRVLHTIKDTAVDFTVGLNAYLLGYKSFLRKFNLFIEYPRQMFSILLPKPQGSITSKAKRTKHIKY